MEQAHEPIRVLLVDDEVEFLDATARALARRGCQVEQATSGEAALHMLEKQRPDVIVLDVKMPGRDGVEIFQTINRRWPLLPVILLTGHGNVQQAFATSREGVFAYLSKPCVIDELLASIHGAAARPIQTAVVGEQPAGEIRVLLIDDETELLEALAKTLTRRGMRVMAAANGNEALQWLEKQVFDVALCDVKMPGIDGIELLRRIKRSQPMLEIILMTGHPEVGLAVQGMQEGAFDYLIKPQTPEALALKIQEAWQRRWQKDEQERQRRLGALRERQPD